MQKLRATFIGFMALVLAQSMAVAQTPPASQPAKVNPVDYQKLKEVLPAAAAGINRSNIEGQNISMGAMSLSQAKGEYIKPNAAEKDPQATIEIMDYGASPEMVAGMTAWRDIPIKVENDQGFQRTTKVKDFPAFETYAKEGEERNIILVIAGRFLVTVRSQYISEADFAKLLESLPWDKLAALK